MSAPRRMGISLALAWALGASLANVGALLPCVAASPSNARPPADVNESRLIAADHEPQNWMTNGRTYSEQHFSPLQQINDHNVGQLGLAWYLEVDSRIGTEATPLVVDGVLYTTSVWNLVHAIDARTGQELWRYDPHVLRTSIRHM